MYICYVELFNVLVHCYYALNKNWWKHNKHPFDLTLKNLNLFPDKKSKGEHFRTNNSLVNAFFCWLIWILVWYFIFIGGLFIALESFFRILTCKRTYIAEKLTLLTERLYRYFIGLSGYQYMFRPKPFFSNNEEPQDIRGDNFYPQEQKLYTTMNCPECGVLFKDEDIIIIPECHITHWVHENCF